jgi:hypothetical protein
MLFIENKNLIKLFASEQSTDHSEKVENKIKEVVVVELRKIISKVHIRDEEFL